MHRIAYTVSLLAGLFVTVPALAAEPLVVDLWPGKTPGDAGIKGQKPAGFIGRRLWDRPS